MDDAWFHTLSAVSSAGHERIHHRRRRSLLQQPTEEKTDLAAEVIPESGEDFMGISPPKATVVRRAQSYSDFYDAVHAYRERENASKRRTSWPGRIGVVSSRTGAGTDFDVEFERRERRLIRQSHGKYHLYQEQLEHSLSHLETLFLSVKDILKLLSTISDSFNSVENQTETFRRQCESLVSEQSKLTFLADAIDENVRYYAFLEPITRRLNAPGAATLVTGPDFHDMLSHLDNCLAYMEAHPKHRESATYRSRYRLLLTRALTLIRHHFTRSLGDIAADIARRLQGEQLKETTHSALLYAKFRVPAPELKSLGLEIQKRAVPTQEDADAGREPEYMSLLRELYQSYWTARGRLMLPLAAKKMAELDAMSQKGDVLAFANASIAFMRGICLDEHELWFEWFETGGAIYDFLESLMEPMLDRLRPKIIHETNLERLCELCAMIQARYMSTGSDEEDEDEVSYEHSPVNGRSNTRKLDFGALVQPALEDAQTRLVFLALNVLRDAIENYRPKPEDLEWPKRAAKANGVRFGPVLSGKRDPTPQTPAVEGGHDFNNGESTLTRRLSDGDSIAALRACYPTLLKATWLLRRIYRLVNSTVFDDLAHRIVHSTVHSLMTASHQITLKKTAPDGQLFLIIHLLHLKQQIVAFDIEFVPPEVDFDFSSLTNTFYELRERGSLWNPASWVRLVSGAVGGGLLPKVVENMLDAKAELDGRLRTVINDFVNGYAGHITAPIERTTVAKGKAEEEPDTLKAVRTVRGLAEKDVPALRAKLLEYVDDARTRETLVAAVRDQVVMSYEDFFDSQSEGTGRKLSRKGKGREDEVWGPDLFSEAMGKVFRVGEVIGGEDVDSESGDVSD